MQKTRHEIASQADPALKGVFEVQGKTCTLLGVVSEKQGNQITKEEYQSMIKAAVESARTAGCDFAFVCPSDPYLMQIALVADCPKRIFWNYREIDVEQVREMVKGAVPRDVLSRDKENPSNCNAGKESQLQGRYIVVYPISESKTLPFAYMIYDKDGNVTEITHEEPKGGRFWATEDFVPGDEARFRIRVQGKTVFSSRLIDEAPAERV